MTTQSSVSINDYLYADNFIASYKDAKTYKAVNVINPDLPPLIFKGYPETYLGDPLKQKKLMQELNFLWKLRNKPNIVQILSQHYRDRMIFIITQFCEEGDLASQVKSKGPFPEEKAIDYISQIINGYRYIHEARILHRNLQPSNILITAESQVKIGDFSHAIHLKDVLMATKREQMVGITYQAPEVLESYAYSEQSDIYSIALIFLFMLKGTTPFAGSNKAEILTQMHKTNLSDLLSENYGIKTRHFLLMALKPECEKRMTIDQLFNYKFQAAPKLILNKHFTFQSGSQRQRRGSFNNKQQLDSIQEIFGDASPSPIRKQIKHSMNHAIDLKASEELDPSVINKEKDISIFIPSKIEIPVSGKEKSKKEFFKLFAVQPSNISVEYEPSVLVLPTEKEQSVVSQRTGKSKKSRSSIQGRMLMSQISSRLSSNRNSQNNAEVTPKASIKVTSPDSTADNTIRNNLQTSQRHDQTISPSRHNETVIEVTVHSPLKPFDRETQKSQLVDQEAVIANFLLSHIDMARFVSRVCYRVKKLNRNEDSSLYQSLLGLRSKLLREVRSLQLLDSKTQSFFRGSHSHETLCDIVMVYEQSQSGFGRENTNQHLLELVSERARLIWKDVSQSVRLKTFAVKTLDFLVEIYRLIQLLKEKKVRKFYEESGVYELLQKKQKEPTIASLVDIHNRMKQQGILTT